MEYIEVASLDELPPNHKLRVEAKDKEILLVNLEGKIYATDDRCGHMNASLAEGELNGQNIRCAIHKAEFDFKTGEVKVPPKIAKVISKTKMGKIFQKVKTHNLTTYDVKIEGNMILIGL